MNTNIDSSFYFQGLTSETLLPLSPLTAARFTKTDFNHSLPPRLRVITDPLSHHLTFIQQYLERS